MTDICDTLDLNDQSIWWKEVWLQCHNMAIAATSIARVLDPQSLTLVRFDQKLSYAAHRVGRGNSSTSMGGGRVVCGMAMGGGKLLTSPVTAINPRFFVQCLKSYWGLQLWLAALLHCSNRVYNPATHPY